MKTGTIVLIAAGGLALYHFLGLGAAAENIQVVFNGISVNSVTNYTFQFIIQNIASTPITYNGLTGTVLLNGTTLGNISSFPNPAIQIPGPGQAPISVTMDLSLLGVAGSVASMINNPGSTLTFETKGALNVSGTIIPVPFDVKQSVNI